MIKIRLRKVGNLYHPDDTVECYHCGCLLDLDEFSVHLDHYPTSDQMLICRDCALPFIDQLTEEVHGMFTNHELMRYEKKKKDAKDGEDRT